MSGINAFFWVLAVATAVVVVGMATEAIVDWLKALAYAKNQSMRKWLKAQAKLDLNALVWRIEVPYRHGRWNPEFLWDMDSAASKDKEEE